MRQWGGMGVGVGIALGLAVGAATGHGAQGPGTEGIRVQTVSKVPYELPASYGHLVGVGVSADVQYLYFEGGDGSLRILLVGPRGSAQRARAELQVLSPDVYVMKRVSVPAAPQAAGE